VRRFFIGYDAWKRQEYLLNRMTLKDLVWAYVTYPGVQSYAALILLFTGLALYWSDSALRLAASAGASILLYPLIWYVLHRWLLHSKHLYKFPATAGLWKRIHFDHHQNPNDLSVLFGGLHTTLPTILLATGPVGWWIGGASGACAAIAAAIGVTCFYEYCHCTQHLAYQPKSKFLQRIKKLHLAHHYHNENGNYGITDFFWDRALGTHYAETADRPRSATVRNLGYTGEAAERYPWVAELTASEKAGPPAENASA